jgi:hypothetical protein
VCDCCLAPNKHLFSAIWGRDQVTLWWYDDNDDDDDDDDDDDGFIGEAHGENCLKSLTNFIT